ncbi:type VII secretion-associated serine protease mycosin [Mycobacterium intermedium]|uniref:Type VII secretion-associated serine protease mycosin n=1 Tax=Mycobacterium intermedium TaxID=28445 RepID=A0A1E3SLF9_MYCIE|nr:type VII secretion-associated serine protease mycosin [Mycobacterium intermedium]OPE47116.1 type VII secretion-associated serine protease mycosin [Mycobacterium intermedium]ORB09629.1 type VII secretion-associated serine protease mycosin [Mycobacterium intermedium]
MLLVAALLALPQWALPSAAHAVAPQPVDGKWLPRPALPAPPQPTVQREECAVVRADATLAGAGAPVQFADFDLPRLWQFTRGGGQRVAVIDTGVASHRRLQNLIAGGDYVSTGDGTQDCDAHGTLVAGIIAAAPDPKADQFSGVAPDATIISIRQSSGKYARTSDRSAGGVGDVDTMAKAVRTAADLGASVINISTVACVPATNELNDRALGAALAYAVDSKNAVVVAAAGNAADDAHCPAQRPDATRQTVTVAVSPAWYDDYVLTVGSVNADGAPSAFTLAGPWVDVAATGEGVTSLSPTGGGIVNAVAGEHGSRPLAGTSYAAPLVSGLVALLRARFPELTARQVMQRIESTAHHPPAGWDALVGDGVVDPLAAISTGPMPQPVAAKAVPLPPPDPQTREKPERRGRNVALLGAASCVVALVAVGLIRPRRKRVAGD